MIEPVVKEQLNEFLTDASMYDTGWRDDDEKTIGLEPGFVLDVFAHARRRDDEWLYDYTCQCFVRGPSSERCQEYAEALTEYLAEQFELAKEEFHLMPMDGSFMFALDAETVAESSDEIELVELEFGSVTKLCILDVDVLEDDEKLDEYLRRDFAGKLTANEQSSLRVEGLTPKMSVIAKQE